MCDKWNVENMLGGSLYIDLTKCFFFGSCCLGLFFLVPVNFACCWDPGELLPAADVNTYHIMHSSCNTIPLSLSVRSMLTEDEIQTK